MTRGDVPEWAKKRACELANADISNPIPYRESHIGSYGHSAITALALYIAQHEEPPVDPLFEALFAVVEMGRYDTREQTALLREELARRGLKIVEAK